MEVMGSISFIIASSNNTAPANLHLGYSNIAGTIDVCVASYARLSKIYVGNGSSKAADEAVFALYNAKYSVIAPTKMGCRCDTKYSIAGKCCESGDKIREDCFLPKMEEGDILAVLSTGAYNYSMASNYNRNLIPPVVIVNGDKSYYAVKPQSYQDIVRNDV